MKALCHIRKVSDNYIILTVDSISLLRVLDVIQPKPKPEPGFKRFLRKIQSIIF